MRACPVQLGRGGDGAGDGGDARSLDGFQYEFRDDQSLQSGWGSADEISNMLAVEEDTGQRAGSHPVQRAVQPIAGNSNIQYIAEMTCPDGAHGRTQRAAAKKKS